MSFFKRLFRGHSNQTYGFPDSQSSSTSNIKHPDFFVVTAIFNPASFENRYTLYRTFAQHMRDCGVQLITIECIFPTLNQTTFQVTQANNPNHIQIRSKNIYWMKESLINIAVQRLPSHCQWICWLDADIRFHDTNWVDLTIQSLEKHTVVQVFEKAEFLGPQGETLRVDYSFGYSVVHGKVIDQTRYDEWYPHPGYGWAMSKTAFSEIGGLPDYDIVGSGDLHFAFSLIDRVTNAIEQDLHPEFQQLIINQSQKMYMTLNTLFRPVGGLVGYVPCTISHNWHGSRKDRQYVNRWKILIAHRFNYRSDVQKRKSGLLEFNRDSDSRLQNDILVHFRMRNEDKDFCYGEDLKETTKSDSDKDSDWERDREKDHERDCERECERDWEKDCERDCERECERNWKKDCERDYEKDYARNWEACLDKDSDNKGNDDYNFENDYNGTIQCTSQY